MAREQGFDDISNAELEEYYDQATFWKDGEEYYLISGEPVEKEGK